MTKLWKIRANYRPQSSYSWALCRVWWCLSVTAGHKADFDAGTGQVAYCHLTWWISIWYSHFTLNMANTKHAKSINKIQLIKGAIALSYTTVHLADFQLFLGCWGVWCLFSVRDCTNDKMQQARASYCWVANVWIILKSSWIYYVVTMWWLLLFFMDGMTIVCAVYCYES